jgi:hypothetical protein
MSIHTKTHIHGIFAFFPVSIGIVNARLIHGYIYTCIQFFVNQYANTTMDVGGFLENRMKQVATAMAQASSASAFYTSIPVRMYTTP